jgi:predicted DNA-binding transcriptional regulator YafY
MSDERKINMTYTNYRGETAGREITPIRVWWGSTQYHPKSQWLLTAFDHGKDAERDFALMDCKSINSNRKATT